MGVRRDDDILDVLERLRPMAERYARDFVGRHLILETKDMCIDVHWLERHFMHLCGLDCTLPRRYYRGSVRPVKSEVFFDALVEGRADSLLVRHAHNRGITADKMSVLPMMLQSPESVEGIAESQSRDYDYFFGGTSWCVGVVLADEPPLDPDAGVHAPRTVRNVALTSRSIIRPGTSPKPLTGARVIPPRR